MQIKAVIFDMDGVLIDSEPLWQEAQIESLSTQGVTISREECIALTMGKKIDEIAQIWRDRYQLTISGSELESMILEKLGDSIARVGVPMAGVYDAIEFFTERGLKIALATSSNHVVIKAVFDKFGLWDKFGVICSAEDEEFGKPHPGVYLTAARELGLGVEECLVIEDSFTGLSAAKAAGMTTYLVSAQHQEERFSVADGRYASLPSVLEDDLSHCWQ